MSFQVPLCAEGKVKPQLCRGHENTKERKENPDLFGGKYMEKIQGLFHSVTGDPRRVPNKSTTGVKWKYPFKDGEAPSGMEVSEKWREGKRRWGGDEERIVFILL